MAELTARRADSDVRARIGELGRSFRVDMPLQEFRQRDREFHEAIARACGNPSLAELYGKVLDTLFRSTDFDSLLSASRNAAVVRRVIREAVRAHQEIAEGIEKQNLPAVRRAAEAHLNQ